MNRNAISRLIQIALVFTIFFAALVIAVRYQTVDVAVLNSPAKAGDTIGAAKIGYVKIPAGAVFPGLVQKGDEIVGKVAQVPQEANVPLKATEFAEASGNKAPKLDPDFPYATAEDLPKLRYAIKTDLLHSSGGSLKVGDYVNIQQRVASKNAGASAQFILQKVHIIGAMSAQGVALSGVPTGGAPGPKSNTIAYWIIALTQSQADSFGRTPWDQLFFFKTDLSKPLLVDPTGRKPVEIASFGSQGTTDGEVDPNATPVPTNAPTDAPATPEPTAAPSAAPTVAPSVTPGASASPVASPSPGASVTPAP